MKQSLRTKLCKSLLFVMLLFGALSSWAKDPGYPSSLYLLQPYGEPSCTLYSNTMMIRARAWLAGRSDWASITSAGVEAVGWIPGAGQRSTFTYTVNGMTFTSTQKYVNGLTVASLQAILNEHPEGICIYCVDVNPPHAQWVTDIENGEVYGSDSSGLVTAGRKPLWNSYLGSVHGNSTTAVLAGVTSYWCITSTNVNVAGHSTTQTQSSANVPNGTYRIACFNDINYNLDIASGSDANEANVQIYENNGSDAQKFKVNFNKDHYTLNCVKTGKNIDLYQAKSAIGTNVQQYEVDGTDVQNWVFKDAGDGAYYIVNSNGLYMDVKDGIIANGSNVQGWEGNKSNAQKWMLVPVNGEQSIPDGDYELRSAKEFNFVADVSGTSVDDGATVHLWESVGANNQKWAVKYVGDGYYTITSKHSNKVLNVKGAGYKGCPDVQQWTYTEGDAASLWMIKSAGNGSFYVVNKNGCFLDVANAKFENGTNLGGWCGNSSDAQKWKFVATNAEQTIEDECYHIRSAADTNFGVDVESVSKEDGANVHLWTIGTGNNQKWHVTHIADGYYSIISVHSGKALDVHNVGIDNGTNIQQWASSAANNQAQQWMIRDAGDGTYYIINRKGLFLDINGGTIANGTNIQGWAGNGSVAQKWVFTTAEIDREAPVICNVEISSIDKDGFTVTANVADNEGIASVKMAAWTEANGQDDLVWKDATVEGNVATCKILTSEHNNEPGIYIVHVYAWDNIGNKTSVAADPVDVDVVISAENPNIVPNGRYRIACYSNPNYVVDVSGKSTSNEGNVHIWEYVEGQNQQFDVTYTDGHYNFKAVHSGKNLDLYKASSAAGTSVIQYEPDGTAVQNWTLQNAGEGAFYIVNSNGLYMDVTGGTIENGTNLQGYTGNQSAAQKWYFIAVNSNSSLPDGEYEVLAAIDTRYAVGVENASTENSASVKLNKLTGADNQKWNVKYLGNGYYSLTAKHSGMALNLSGGGCKAEADVIQYPFKDGEAGSQWILRGAGNGNFYVINKNGLFLDAAGGTLTENVNIWGYKPNSSGAQLWKFVPTDGVTDFAEGVYRVRNSANRTFGLDVEQVSTDNDANVYLWTLGNGDNQKWNVKNLGNGYYSLTAVHSGLALDLEGAGTSNGTNVRQHTVNNGPGQQWMLRPTGNGSYYIVNKNGLYVDVSSGKVENGSNIQGWTGNGTEAQKWLFAPIVTNDTENPTVGVINVAVSAVGFKVKAKVYDNSLVTSVKMATWTRRNGQDDIEWQEAKMDGDVASCEFKISNHNKEVGFYELHVYAYDESGNQTSKASDVIDVPVANGAYRIAAFKDNAIGFDVSGANKDNGANVQLWTYEEKSNHHKYIFTRNSEGYYTIQAGHNGKSIDAKDAKAENGTNIQTWESGENNNAQLWKLVHNEDGSYTFKSKLNEDYVIDVAGGTIANGTNLQLYKGNDSEAQKFNLIPVTIEQTTAGGGYSTYSGGMGGSGQILAYGVDVSEHQGVGFNFRNLVNQGCKFAILRCGFSTRKDYRFEEYYTNAKAAGLDVGAYFYCYSNTVAGALQDAEECLSHIAGKQFEYPIYYDFEDSSWSYGCDSKAVCLAFLDRVASAGYLVGLYGYASWMDRDYPGRWVPVEEICQKYECWMANYPYAQYVDSYANKYKTRYGMFQFTDGQTSSGLAAGYGLDTNMCFKDYPSIVKQHGFNGYSGTGSSTVKTDYENSEETVYEVTEIEDMKNKSYVQSVQYVNVNGQISEKPVPGVNIAITTYVDGSQSTKKVIMK